MTKQNKNTPPQGATPATKKNTAQKKPPRLDGLLPLLVSLEELEDGSFALDLALGEEPVFNLREIVDDNGTMEAFEDMCDWGCGRIPIPADKAREVHAWMFENCKKVYRNGKRVWSPVEADKD